MTVIIKKLNVTKTIIHFVTELLILLICISAVNGEWTVYKRIEQSSKEGHLLRFDTGAKDTIRAWFILKNSRTDVFKTKLALYQIDENEVHDLKLIKAKRINKNRWIRWNISDDKRGGDLDLLEFMNGKEVIFQYYLPDGTIKETTFNLEGARKAIEGVLK